MGWCSEAMAKAVFDTGVSAVCTLDAEGYSFFVITSVPTESQIIKICASSQCQKVVAAMKTAQPTECNTGAPMWAFQLYAQILNPIAAKCGQSAPTSAHLPPTATPPTATTAPPAITAGATPATTTPVPSPTASGSTSATANGGVSFSPSASNTSPSLSANETLLSSSVPSATPHVSTTNTTKSTSSDGSNSIVIIAIVVGIVVVIAIVAFVAFRAGRRRTERLSSRDPSFVSQTNHTNVHSHHQPQYAQSAISEETRYLPMPSLSIMVSGAVQPCNNEHKC